MAKFIDLTGQKFGYLMVIGRSSDCGNGAKPTVKWDCLCDCGARRSVTSGALRTGHTVSCGCKKRKHGFSHKERLYETWKNMRRRCNDPKNKRYAQYGGRGISVCPEWNDYAVFRSWALSAGYTDELSIDRIDVNGNYCPENCRWADAKTQANNTSRNRYIEFEGEMLTMAQIAERTGKTYSTIQHRVERGQDLHD